MAAASSPMSNTSHVPETGETVHVFTRSSISRVSPERSFNNQSRRGLAPDDLTEIASKMIPIGD
jgi:hypothetical protein